MTQPYGPNLPANQGFPPPPQGWQQPAPGWTGAPGWAPAPAPVPTPSGPGIGTHLRRAVDWNLAEIVATPRERDALLAAGVEPRLHGLFVWRRSLLLVAMPLLLLSVVLAFVAAKDDDTDGYTDLGVLTIWLPRLALVCVPLGALVLIRNWTSLHRGSKALIAFWLVSVAVPLLVAIIPLDYVIDIDGQRQQVALNGGDVASFDALVLITRITTATTLALTLLPVVLSVPGGVLKGAARVKSLFPSAALPGWFLVAVAPFYSMFMVVVFVLIDQIVGNGVLLTAVALLAFTPWLFVIRRRVYGRPLSSSEAAKELPRASRLGGWLTIAAVALIVVFACTATVQGHDVVGTDSDTAYFSVVDVLRAVGEMLSRGLVTTVVFSTVFVYLVFAEWRSTSTMHPEVRAEHESQMRALGQYLGRR